MYYVYNNNRLMFFIILNLVGGGGLYIMSEGNVTVAEASSEDNNNAVEVNMKESESEMEKKARLMMESFLFKMIFSYAFCVEQSKNVKNPNLCVISKLEFYQPFLSFMNSSYLSVEGKDDFSEENMFKDFFDYLLNKNYKDGFIKARFGGWLWSIGSEPDIDLNSKEFENFKLETIKFWQNEIMKTKKFIFDRDYCLQSAAMCFSVIPQYFVNETWRNSDDKTVAFDVSDTGDEKYKNLAIEDIKRYDNLRSNRYEENIFKLCIMYYFLDKYDNNWSYKDILYLTEDVLGGQQSENLVRVIWLSKYFQDKMVVCMFDQTLIGKEIDCDTIEFWRTVFENASNEQVNNLIIGLNFSDSLLRKIFNDSKFREEYIKEPTKFKTTLDWLSKLYFDVDLFNKFKFKINNSNNVNSIFDDDLFNEFESEFTSNFGFISLCSKFNVEKRFALVNFLYSERKTRYDNMVYNTYNTEDFKSFFIEHKDDEKISLLFDLMFKYPKIFVNRDYDFGQKFMAAKALIPMNSRGFNIQDFNSMTLKPFLSICKTPEEFRVAYVLWKNTNFINQFWLMRKLGIDDLKAIVRLVGNSINDEAELNKKIKFMFDLWPAFGQKNWFKNKEKDINILNCFGDINNNEAVDMLSCLSSFNVIKLNLKENLAVNIIKLNSEELKEVKKCILENTRHKNVFGIVYEVIKSKSNINITEILQNKKMVDLLFSIESIPYSSDDVRFLYDMYFNVENKKFLEGKIIEIKKDLFSYNGEPNIIKDLLSVAIGSYYFSLEDKIKNKDDEINCKFKEAIERIKARGMVKELGTLLYVVKEKLKLRNNNIEYINANFVDFSNRLKEDYKLDIKEDKDLIPSLSSSLSKLLDNKFIGR